MVVLSLFDGMSCGRLALERAGVKIDKYIASEIKPIAIKLTTYHFPDTIHVGDVCDLKYCDGVLFRGDEIVYKGYIDLLIGGSPCQDFSLLKADSKGLDGDKSKLFYEFLRLKKEINPTYFLLENVRMKKNSKEELDSYLGVEGVAINSNLVSFQNRPRIYWSNISYDILSDRCINFQDYKDTDYNECLKVKLNRTPSRIKMWSNGVSRTSALDICANITHSNKIGCVTRKQDRCPNSGLIEFDDFCRYLTRRELELAQTVPIGYTDILSYNQACDLLGDGWTIDVIAHIFSYLNRQL